MRSSALAASSKHITAVKPLNAALCNAVSLQPRRSRKPRASRAQQVQRLTRGSPEVVLRINGRLVVQEELECVGVAIVRREHQRRSPVAVQSRAWGAHAWQTETAGQC